MEYITNNENETIEIAINLSKNLKPSDIVVLTGELGAGKTKFMSGIAKYFNIENQISSPTFTIVNEYALPNEINKINTIYHFDVYRIFDSSEFVDSIGTDYFNMGLCILEWGENISDILPKHTIFVNIEKDLEDINKRKITIKKGEI